MPAAKTVVVFEWETGTKDNRVVHSVPLEIPPKSLKISRQKNVQKMVTTKGHTLNHGLENLPVISASGVAYHPLNASDQGYNPNSAFAGLEYLNSAYVASGRISSDPSLVSTVKVPTNLSPLTQKTSAVSNSKLFSLGGLIQTAQARVKTLQTMAQKVLPFGQLTEIGEFVASTTDIVRTISTTHSLSLKNIGLSTLSGVTGLNQETTSTLSNLISAITPSNAEAVNTQVQQLAQTNTQLSNLASKFEYFYNKYLNDNSSLSISNLDPTVGLRMLGDPYVFLKSTAGTAISNKLVVQQAATKDTIKASQSSGTSDWVVTILLYIQDMVFSGHFEQFNMAASAEVLGLWNWDFTFVAHQSFILKDNNVIPFDRAFDTTLTQQNQAYPIFQQKDRFDVLEAILNTARRFI